MRFQPVAQCLHGVEGRREPSHTGHDGAGKPIGCLLFASYVEACYQFSAELQRAQDFGVCHVLVGKHMEAVHGECDVEGVVFEWQCTYIALHRLDVGDACLTEPVFGLFQHVAAIVEAGDVGLGHTCVLSCCKYGSTYWHVKQSAREIIGNPTEHPAGDLVVIDSSPKQFEIQTAPPFALSDSVVVEAFAETVRILDLVCHNLLLLVDLRLQR